MEKEDHGSTRFCFFNIVDIFISLFLTVPLIDSFERIFLKDGSEVYATKKILFVNYN